MKFLLKKLTKNQTLKTKAKRKIQLKKKLLTLKLYKTTWSPTKFKSNGRRCTPFAIYLTKQKGWLSKVFSEYSEGSEHWTTLAVILTQHSTRTFEGHAQPGKQTNTIRKWPDDKLMLVKGRVYKQMCDGERKQMVRTKEKNTSENFILRCEKSGLYKNNLTTL